jgi:cobalt-zinc-cadmium efflux system outer membrane protein
MHAFRPGLVSLFATTCLWGGMAVAATAPPYDTLLKASASAPVLTESAAELDAAEARLRQAQVWRNPELSLQAENFAGQRPNDGFDTAETTLSLSQTFELGGKREARVLAARSTLLSAKARQTATRVDFAARLAIVYAEAEASVERVRHAEELQTAAQSDARSARLLVKAGKEAALRGVRAEADAGAALADLEEARAKKDAAFARLTALSGSPTPYDAVGASLLGRTPARLSDGTSPTNPTVAAAEALRNAAAARVRVERTHANPDVTVSAGIRRFAVDDTTALVAGVSVPLPIFDRNKGATQAAQAELRAADARLQQARLDAEAERLTGLSKVRSAAARVQAAQAGEAAASEAYRLARIGYEAGRIALVELTSARRALAEARTRTVDARLDQVRAEAEAARAAGRTPFGA